MHTTYFDMSVFIGELIGSLILTLGIMMATVVMKRKSFGLDTKWKQKLFFSFALITLVAIGISAAAGFKGLGAINPGIAIMVAVMDNAWSSLPTWLAGEFAGGIIAAGVFFAFVKGFNISTSHKEKIVLKENFQFSTQTPAKAFGMEIIANFFWYLPLVGLLMLEAGNDKTIVALVGGLSIAATLLVTTEIGMANLNPQVWLGEFIIKAIGSKGKITKQNLIAEFTGLTAVVLVGFACGGIAYGVKALHVPHFEFGKPLPLK